MFSNHYFKCHCRFDPRKIPVVECLVVLIIFLGICYASVVILMYKITVDCIIIYLNNVTYNPYNDNYQFEINYNITEYACNKTYNYVFDNENKAMKKYNRFYENNYKKCCYYAVLDEGPCNSKIDCYSYSYVWILAFIIISIYTVISIIACTKKDNNIKEFEKKNYEIETLRGDE